MSVLDNFDIWLIDWITVGKDEVRKELYENIEKTSIEDFQVYFSKDNLTKIPSFRLKVKMCLASNKITNRKKLKNILDEQLLNKYSIFERQLEDLKSHYEKKLAT